MFKFSGQIHSSKSLYNRALVVQSYFPNLKINGYSESTDVIFLNDSLKQIDTNNILNAGMGGTTFRFLSLKASRLNKVSKIHVHPRLLERPQQDLWNLFDQLGVKYSFSDSLVTIQGNNWNLIYKTIEIQCEKSTQFASAFLLNCWLLPNDVRIILKQVGNSQDYLEMTIKFLIDLGMEIQVSKIESVFEIIIPANQTLKKWNYIVEPDMSSVATLAMAAVIDGEISISNFPNSSLQPDYSFLNYFKLMQINYQINNDVLKVQKHDQYDGINCNLQQTPDLFPCLVVLAAFARTQSYLWGVPQLKHKESDRLRKTIELLHYIGCEFREYSDGLEITQPVQHEHMNEFLFNPDHDHRMAMAGGLIQLKKFPLRIQNSSVVQKSFSNYFEIIGVQP